MSVLAPAMLLGVHPVTAADLPPSIAGSGPNIAPTLANPEVDSFMAVRHGAPVWFRDGGAGAPTTLAQILRRAPLDGLASGPALADAVEAAARDAASGNPQAIDRADRILSSAWLEYITALKASLPGFTYSDPSLVPRVPNPWVTLQQASAAPSLAAHLLAVANVNPIYGPIRDAEWLAMKRSGDLTPDPRALANLDRARILPSSGRYLVVEAATQRLLMVEEGRIADSMKVIVGRLDSQTPMLASTIWYATLNPYWYVPTDLTQKIVARKMQSPIAKAYWKEKGYEILSDFGPTPTILPPSSINWKAVEEGKQTVYLRQLPGPGNSMGVMKFSFPNDIGVYLHDTDLHGLFDQKQRTLSNGCIRLEDAKRLGLWLAGRDLTTESTTPEQHFMLPRGVPVYLTYITAMPQGSELAFVPDIYGRDGVGPRGTVATAATIR
jgi:hypothetical protein